MSSYLTKIIFLCLLPISYVLGHGAVVYPPPRNNIDHDISPWTKGVPMGQVPAVSNPDFGYWCPVPDGPTALSGTGCGHGVVTHLLQYYCSKEVTTPCPHPVCTYRNTTSH